MAGVLVPFPSRVQDMNLVRLSKAGLGNLPVVVDLFCSSAIEMKSYKETLMLMLNPIKCRSVLAYADFLHIRL